MVTGNASTWVGSPCSAEFDEDAAGLGARVVPHRRPSIPEDRLHLEVLLHPEHPVLAAVARLAVAAERRVARPGREVDMDLSRADAAGHAPGAFLVGGLDVAAEPVDGRVGDPDRLL